MTEQPSPDGAPETSVGDPVLDGLGTSEATPAEAADTASASPAGEPVELDQPVEVVEVVEVVDVEPVDDGTLGDASTDDENPKTGRRRRTS